ncbi:MAG: methionine biosynthesis protein MetW [Pseudobacter sp.]|uniref:methionine biosynthesis protein MetW n=1 Tax=Pseudobacter sp. TaxID=2045420 RepID=UPI003F7EE404
MKQSDPIRASWEANAANWIETIANNEIESRVLVTNEAIVQAVLAVAPASVLDIGCGESWLTHLLRSKGIEAYGVDAVASL